MDRSARREALRKGLDDAEKAIAQARSALDEQDIWRSLNRALMLITAAREDARAMLFGDDELDL